LLEVDVQRQNYDGRIDLNFEGLPAGIEVRGNHIPEAATKAFVTLSRIVTATEEDAAALDSGSTLHCVLVRLQGTSFETNAHPQDAAHAKNHALQQAVNVASAPWNLAQPALREQLAVGIADHVPLTVKWKKVQWKKVQWKESAQWKGPGVLLDLPAGGRTELPVSIHRSQGTKGKVRLSLLVNQSVPNKQVQKDDGKQQQVPDVARSLHLDGKPVIEADQSDSMVTLLSPVNPTRNTFDVVLRAELLSEDGKKVLATAHTQALAVKVHPMFLLQLAKVDTINVSAGKGKTGVIDGRVLRKDNQQGAVPLERGAVSLELVDLPTGYTSPRWNVTQGKSEFAQPIRFRFKAKPGTLSNVRVLARWLRKEGDPNSELTAISSPLKLIVTTGKPDAEVLPHELFNNQSSFLAALTTGDANMVLTASDVQSGPVALQLGPGSRSNAKLQGWELKIREKPQVGEFRYLRYAWKKSGSGRVTLQLAHDGKFGTLGDKPLAYTAGEIPSDVTAIHLGKTPTKWNVVTRDLFADFGEFTLTGLGIVVTGDQPALLDSLYLSRTKNDFKYISTD